MVFNPLYQATDEANQFQMASDTVNYSHSNDRVSVDVSSDLIRGQYTLLHSGDDEYYGTDFDSPGWDNVANGNRGNDYLEGDNDSRDYFRGGKDDDQIYGEDGGNDMLFGDFGEDYVEGSWGGNNILRGGKGNDELVGGMRRDLLVGDFGTDVMEGKDGSDFFVLRTDSNTNEGLQSLTPNAAEADRITDFSADDYLVITGMESHWDVNFIWNGADVLVEIMSDLGPQYAGILEGPGMQPTAEQLIIGQTAENILAAADGDAVSFTNDPNILNSFGL
jgi:Ca2+-binding RTX toxin-like protein